MNWKKWLQNLVDKTRQLENRLAEGLRRSLLELNRIDRANVEVMQLIQDTQYGPFVAGFYRRMDALENLLPPVEDETAAQHEKRKLALVALAVNAIHEDPECGADFLLRTNDPTYTGDMKLMYNDIFDRLKQVNNHDAARAQRWAELAESASRGDYRSR